MEPGLQPTVEPHAQHDHPNAISPRPFLKWAGGKRQLLPVLRRFYPQRFNVYHEPFLGSGAVLFDLINLGHLREQSVRLSDVNADLVGCYQRLLDEPSIVISHLQKLESDYRAAPLIHYYKVRDEMFNSQRAAIMTASRPNPDAYSAELAAMFIYLNKTGFNGLFRLNSKGKFNVPQGRYTNPRICDTANLLNVSAALNKLKATVTIRSFEELLDFSSKNDFVYLDPPYAPTSKTSNFTSYTSSGFSREDQQHLQQVVINLATKGCFVLLSNSTAPEVATLYDGNQEALRVGLKAYKFPARRSINSNGKRRGQVLEYIITNIHA